MGPYKYVQAGKNNEWSRITDDEMSQAFQDLIVRPQSRGGNTTVGNWNKQWSPKYEKPLEIVSPESFVIPALPVLTRLAISKAATTPIFGKWVYSIPKNANMAYRRMGPLERDWIMSGNELSTRATNELTEIEAASAREQMKHRGISLFKESAEHGGRKQFAKGEPWHGNTTTHGKEQVLAIPGKNLKWVSGRHYHGPQGSGFRVGEVPFEEVPFGSHIDLLTNEAGFSGVNPSMINGSVIYSPFNIFGRDFGYKILKPIK